MQKLYKHLLNKVLLTYKDFEKAPKIYIVIY